ncbi:unnamed protein product [Schistosoma mattheei]|uniref:Uncharacterized protein n=1 Tax=Schistosoma mattheei TaxID=31246 RepID=A0AA85B164_9TREM|nr:unnamed protein product [Schistosoma mattheei]
MFFGGPLVEFYKSQLTRSQLHVALGQLIDPRTSEYQHEKTLRKAQLETKKQTMLISIDEMTNGLLTRIDENVSKAYINQHRLNSEFKELITQLHIYQNHVNN